MVRLVLKRRPSRKNPAAYTASGSDLGNPERRELSLKGREAPLAGRILRS
jgi:hypothetical protein